MSRETLENKIEQLIERAESDNSWYEATKKWTTKFESLFFNSTIRECPRMSFENATMCQLMLANSPVETISYRIGGDKVTSYYRTFQYCKNLKFIYGVACLSNTSFLDAWYGCSSLETIQEPFELASDNKIQWGNAFSHCERLQNIRFAKNCIRTNISFGYSPLLSDESVQSIIDGLATVETAQKVTFSSVTVLKLTTEQLTQIANKNWSV